jgi:hypothetical protein
VIQVDQAGKSYRVLLAFVVVPLVPVAALLFLLAVERLEGRDNPGIREFKRSQSALGDTVDRAREVG